MRPSGWERRRLLPNLIRMYTLSTLATTLYRAGQHEQSIARLDEAVKLRTDGATAYDFFIYALAHHGLGHAAEAKQSFNKCLDWMVHAIARRPMGPKWTIGRTWIEFSTTSCDGRSSES